MTTNGSQTLHAASPAMPHPEAHAGLVEDNLVLSGDPSLLYPEGGFAGDAALFDRLRSRTSANTRILGQVFPPFRLHRPEPRLVIGAGAAFRDRLSEKFARIAARPAEGPATLLCASRDIRLSGNALFYVEDGLPKVLFETFRPQDRPVVVGPGADFARIDESVPDEGVSLLLNSAGSFNYGHWLIDDLPRLAAFATLRRRHPGALITLFLVSYHGLIDEARKRSIDIYLSGERDWRIRFLDRDRTTRFAKLHHVTPATLPPLLKSPDALGALADAVARRTRLARWRFTGRRLAARAAPRLFVDRHPARERRLINRDAVAAFLRDRGFEIFDPEAATFGQQAIRFACAELVVGVAGAGMANTVFCAPGTPLVYLTPEGWEDGFYWDLAAGRGHPYCAVLGARTPSDAPEFLWPFSIDLQDLDAALRALGLA